MAAYYNEIDPYCAAWLRNLIAARHIAAGDVDERSIEDVRPDDLRGYTQCHFFAGIGVWSHALRSAGTPDTQSVWTGSAPCQPFSAAGQGAGFADERHLWPAFFHLIEQCRPPIIFGEQVAAATEWICLVRCDLEAVGYTMGAMPIEAASAGADHYRDRYFFVASDDQQCAGAKRIQRGRQQCGASGDPKDINRALPDRDNAERRADESGRHIHVGGAAGRIKSASDIAECRPSDVVDDSSIGWGEGWTEHEFRSRGFTAAVASADGCQYVECPDGKWRRLPPPGVRWLGNGIDSRVAKLRAIGNAIDPRPAAEFIRAVTA